MLEDEKNKYKDQLATKVRELRGDIGSNDDEVEVGDRTGVGASCSELGDFHWRQRGNLKPMHAIGQGTYATVYEAASCSALVFHVFVFLTGCVLNGCAVARSN